MRYRPEHKQESRARLVEAGAALAKQEGFGNTGLQALMAAADMTTGAFYTQFASKPELLQAIVEHELGKTLQWFEGQPAEQIAQNLGFYLSPRHVENPGQGCAIPSLGAEIARADLATRQVFEEHLLRIHAAVAAVTHDEDAAWAVVCQAIGGVMVARAMATPERRREVLKGVLAQARAVLAAAAR